MGKRLFLLLTTLISSIWSYSQTTVWTEDFQNSCAANCTAATYTGTNGSWTVTQTGTNGTDANVWYVSGAECGNAAGSCGSNCGATDPSLHISSSTTALGDHGAAYLSGGFGTIDPVTDVRAESPVINLTGASNLYITFDYIENGDGTNDNAILWYFDGTSWSVLQDMAKTTLCGSGQGTWTTLTVALPTSAANNPNVQIGFQWVNNSDNIGTDPSVAIDDISIISASAPVADFSASSTTICPGDCITYTNNSTYATGATFAWDFGNGQTSTLETPGTICYTTAGTYTVTLTVTDPFGTDTETKTAYITVSSGGTAGSDNNGTVCNTGSIDLNTLLSGASSGGTWEETTSTPSGQFNTSTGIFDANGATTGIYTFNYIVTSSGSCPADTAEFSITVNSCTSPQASFTASDTVVCMGNSLTFTDNSTGTNIATWNWTFGGGSPATANTQGPHTITFSTPGTYTIVLSITDDNGTSQTSMDITVNSCQPPQADFIYSSMTVCRNQCMTFYNTTVTDSPTSYVWVFDQGTPATSTAEDSVEVCYLNDTTGTFTVKLYASNPYGVDSITQNVTIIEIPEINAYYDTIINMMGTALLYADSGLTNYSWTWTMDTPGGDFVCDTVDCSYGHASPLYSTDYIVTTIDPITGCPNSDTVHVFVNFEEHLGVPTMFSPDGNGVNDVLYVKGFGLSWMEFKVYDRYGELVFKSNDQYFGWDGTYKGEKENPATFAYTLKYTLIDGTSGTKSGNVTLVR